MSKANKNKFHPDASTQGENNLDSNQSAKSMSNAGTANSVEGSAHDVDPVNAMDNEGGASQPGQERDSVDGESLATDGSAKNRTQSSGEYDSADSSSESEGSLMSRAASLLDSQAVKKNLNLVKDKANDFVSSSKEQLGSKFSTLSDDVKLRGMLTDEKIKTNPYAYALGAVGIGFILGRAFSGKGKADLDVLVSTVNKMNFSTLAGMFGVKASTDAQAEGTYNEDQARKIG
jgi:ElaB/YqjD/DUF883 family membrane-anchored ribosome-binding protein